MNPEKKSFTQLLSNLRNRYKMRFQSFALALALIVPFALYFSLENGLSILTTSLLVLFGLSMAIIAWVG
ncbi:MAG: hypothetical protein MUO76_04940 [Anaerolineaceae bacterium]|nr:hypothetical protein [Anaerolineaceae bacterium]